MAKTMRMEPLQLCNKITARQPTHKLVLICNTFMSNNSSYKSLKKLMIMKGSNHTSNRVIRGKITAEKTNKSLISRHKKTYPASAHLFGLLGPFLNCATVQGLNFSGFVVVTVVVVVASLFLRLLENIKLWRWLMHQYKEEKKRVKNKPREETRSKAVARKWTWIEDLVSGLDVSDVDDLFVSTCILMVLGFLCGLLVLVRRFSSKNVEE